MEMGEQYRLADLRQLMAGRNHFPPLAHVADSFPGHGSLTSGAQQQHYEMMMVGQRGVGELVPQRVDFRSDSSSVSAFEEGGCVGDGGNGRWPRQETLTLLDIRSRLDSKFKEANQKGPLWDEVSRIMAEEHGYRRSGKKCREKFENLYKYYKKTREGKAGRQDGKHYRFFRQLDALYGDSNNTTSETNLAGNKQCLHVANPLTTQPSKEALQAHKLCESLSISNSSNFNTSSSEDDDPDCNGVAFTENGVANTSKGTKSLKRGRKSWKSKIKEFVDLQMKKFMEIQEAWLEKMLNTLEHKEQERMYKQEEWRKQEEARIAQEHKFWANERAWCEARDAALMEALQKISGRELQARSPEELTALDIHDDVDKENEIESEALESSINNKRWQDSEISTLIKLRSSVESRFQEAGYSKSALWEEISAKLNSLGYDRSAKRCKEKWENINKYFRKTKECNKKRKENARSCPYFHHIESLYNQGGGTCSHESDDQVPERVRLQLNDGPSRYNPNVSSAANDCCLRFMMGERESLWENYGLKFGKENNQ